jgi:hypothetical protein
LRILSEEWMERGNEVRWRKGVSDEVGWWGVGRRVEG